MNEQLQLIRQEQITGEQIYQLLLAFNQLYPTFTEADQKRFMQAFVERVDIYPQKTKEGIWIRSITFHFPVPIEGKMVRQLPLDSQTMHERLRSEGHEVVQSGRGYRVEGYREKLCDLRGAFEVEGAVE